MSRDYSPEDLAQPRDSSPVARTRGVTQRRPNALEESDRGRAADNRAMPRPAPEKPHSNLRSSEPRMPFKLHDRIYRLRGSEIQTMVDVGKFRALDPKDLEQFAYAGNRSHLQADLANLRRQRLIVQRQMPRRDARPRQLVALTKEGRRFLIAHERVPKNQALYYGFSKPREAHHDADLYRVYQKAADQITKKGGKNIRVVLDAELKRVVYRDLARAKRDTNSPDTAAIAERHGLKVIRGKIPVPDLRIEYESADRDPARVDLELATEHYRFRNLAQKANAGFSMYARADELSKLRRVMDDRELIAEIMSL